MTRFYIPPDQIPGGIPQSEPTEVTALKMQIQRMRETLKLVEWGDIGFVFSVAAGGDVKVHRCPICNYTKEAGFQRHEPRCKLAALLKETE